MSRTHATVLAVAALAGAGLAAPASATVAAPATSTPAVKAAVVRTTVGHARLALPAGWEAARTTDRVGTTWCLRPKGTRSCSVAYSEPGANDRVNPDVQGGYDSDPAYCGVGGGNGPLTRGTVTRWGGREAEYRRWDIRCGRKAGPTVVQYVVPTFPVSSLFAEVNPAQGNAVDATMRKIVAGSVLPKQTRPVRLAENGYLRSAVKTTGGYKVTIDRVLFDGRGKVYNSSTRAYAYTVPTTAVKGPLRVGRLVQLRTDGFRGIWLG